MTDAFFCFKINLITMTDRSMKIKSLVWLWTLCTGWICKWFSKAFNFFPQIYLERQRKRGAMENHLHIHPLHRVRSQTSDFIVMLLSIIVIRLILKENNNAPKFSHQNCSLKNQGYCDIMRNGRLNHNESWVINYLIFLQRGWMVQRCDRTCHAGLF